MAIVGRATTASEDLPLLTIIKRATAERDGFTQILPPGALDVDVEFRASLTKGIIDARLDRVQVGRRMAELLGREITKAQLDSWTAESKDGHRFPAAYLPAFCRAVGTNAPLALLVESAGAHLLTDRERLLVEKAALEEEERQLRNRRRQVEDALGGLGRGGR
jgi:hypothetical protein